ncbi:MAG: hypothetical protein ABEJ76_08405 [Halanaeroarchaeum sp.]
MSRLDGMLVRAFGRHASDPRLAAMRQRYRGTDRGGDFETAVSRIFGASWMAFALGSGLGIAAVYHLSRPRVVAWLGRLDGIGVPGEFLSRGALAVAVGLLAGLLAKWATIRAAGSLLAHRARRRRNRLDRTLPRTVRFMHVLAAGTTDERTLLAAVAERERTFGETARAFQSVLGTATVAGSLDRALRLVARDTPSRRTFAPFLLTYRARAREGPAALARFLHLESRMLARQDAQRTDAARRYFGLVLRLFVLFLVIPAVVAVVVGLLAGFGASDRLPTVPVDVVTANVVVLSQVGALAVLLCGVVASGVVYALRPTGYRWSRYRTADSLSRLVARVPRNPANAFVVLAPVGGGLGAWLWARGVAPSSAAVFAYASVALPVGLVDWRRARLDAAKDRYLPDLIYAIAHQVHLGRSFPEAVDRVAAEGRLGALDADVADLAFDLRVAPPDRPVRAAALDRFVDRVGTPLAERTVGMVAGALDAGSETAAAFDALQSEAGRLYHEEQAVSDRMALVVVVGWLVSLLVVVIVVAVDVAAMGSAVVGPGSGGLTVAATRNPRSGTVASLYVLTQATMLSSGWFAGVAGRGVYEGLLHSGGLVLLAFLAFAGAGLL